MLYLSMLWPKLRIARRNVWRQRRVLRRLEKQLPNHTRVQRVGNQITLDPVVSRLQELVQELFALEKRLKICKQRSATGKVTKRSVLNRKWAVWRETTGYIPRSPPMTPP